MDSRQFSGLLGQVALKEIKENPNATIPDIELAIRQHNAIHIFAGVQDDIDPGWSRRWAEWASRKVIAATRADSSCDINSQRKAEARKRIQKVASEIGQERFSSQNKALARMREVSHFLFGVKISNLTYLKNKDVWQHLVTPPEKTP